MAVREVSLDGEHVCQAFVKRLAFSSHAEDKWGENCMFDLQDSLSLLLVFMPLVHCREPSGSVGRRNTHQGPTVQKTSSRALSLVFAEANRRVSPENETH